MRRPADLKIRDWLDSQPLESIWVTAITVFEVRLGIAILARGRRRKQLEEDFVQALAEDFDGRVLDRGRCREGGDALCGTQITGPIDFRDTLIAGIAVSRRAQLATRTKSP